MSFAAHAGARWCGLRHATPFPHVPLWLTADSLPSRRLDASLPTAFRRPFAPPRGQRYHAGHLVRYWPRGQRAYGKLILYTAQQSKADSRGGWCRAALIALLSATAALAQAPDPLVEAIEFEGLQRTSQTFARGLIHARVGDPLDPAQLDQDAARLGRSPRFLSATWRAEPGQQGTVVRFTLVEQPVVTAIEFEGNDKYKDGKLAKLVPIKVGDPLDRFLIREGEQAVANKYRDGGYGEVTVSFDEQRAQQTGEVVFTIVEGVRVRIDDIRFEGATAFPDRVLERKIKLKPAMWIFRKGVFDPDQAQRDVAALQRYYRDQGYLDALVVLRKELSDDGSELTLVFEITEGVRYRIEALRFSGQSVYDEAELRSLMTLAPGEIVLGQQLQADVRSIQEHYGRYGYIEVSVRPTVIFSDTPELVQVLIEITEGSQYRVGQVVPRGNTRTRDKVVRRALSLYPPDDLLNLTEVREAERRLRESGNFASASIYPVGDAPDSRDLIVDVKESEKAGDFLFGFGVTSNSGLVGSFVLDIKNFDLADRPRTFGEFIRFRAFHGGGQRLRLEAQPGTELTRFRMDFTEPYLFDRPVRLDLNAYLFTRGRDRYNERRVGANVSLGKRFERGRWQGWSAEGAARITNVTIDEIDLLAARDVYDVKGDNLLLSLRGTAVRDRRDSRFLPTRGDRWQLAYEQVAGDDLFGKLSLGYLWHHTVRRDLLERPSVLAVKAETGLILGDAPIFERYFSGGYGSIRGFAFRGVGPREGINETNVGGDFMLTLSSEYSFPLHGEMLRGLVFVDMGTVEPELAVSTWRASVGTGIRMTLDLLGPIPLEFDIAVPVMRDTDDQERLFSFFFGTAF